MRENQNRNSSDSLHRGHRAETADGITYDLIRTDKHTGLEAHTLISKDPDFGIFYYHQSRNAVPASTLEAYGVPYEGEGQRLAEADNDNRWTEAFIRRARSTDQDEC